MPAVYLLFACAVLPLVSLLFPFDLSESASKTTTTPSAACQSPAFSGSRVSNTLAAAQDSAVADFDSDGRLDLAVKFGGFGGTLTVQFGTGNGYIGAPRVIDTDSSGFSVTAGDFNNDGRIDLLTPTKIFFGDGSGNFSAPRLFVLNPNTFGYSSGDFNGDDNLDVAGFVFSNSTIEIFYGDGFGGFGPATIVGFSGGVNSFDISDLNGDGIADLAAVLSNVNQIDVVFGSETGVFSAPVNYAIGGEGSIDLIASGDLDGDGDRDLLAADSAFGFGSIGFMVVLINNGNGNFAVQPRFSDASTSLSRLLLADLNSDGKADLIANSQLSSLTVRFGNGNGTFQEFQLIPGFVGQSRLYFEDFTGDGIRDLGLPSSSVASFAVLVNDATGNLGMNQFVIDSDFFVVEMLSNDFNEDGRPDIAFATESTNVKVAFGDGNGGFGSILSLPVSKMPRAMVTGDVNSDGNVDLLLIIQNNGDLSSKVAVLFGNGNGTFQPSVETTEFFGPIRRKPILADINDDGFPELILNGSNVNLVNIFQNVGGGSFVFRTNFSAGNTVGGIAAGDFDQDGRTDLAVLSFGVNMYLGNGAFGFGLSGTFPAGQVNSQIIANDFNEDGILDIAATTDQSGPSPAPGKVVILLGVGKAGFGAPTEYIVGRGPATMGFADFDGDGNKDLAITNSGYSNAPDSRISVLYGNGLGGFPRVTFTAGAPFPRGLLVGDFNSDLRPDLITAGFFMGSLVESFGQCLPTPTPSSSSLSVNDTSVTEGNVGDMIANVTVSLSSPTTTTVRVRYYTAPLIGIANLSENQMAEPLGRRDYRPVSGELRFLPGETSKTIQIAVRGDTIDEFDEKFSVFLANTTNAVLSDSQGIVTILDDDVPPSVSVGNASGTEGNSGNSPINIPLTLSALSEKPVSLQYLTGGGTAVANQDYVRAQGTATIPPGQSSGSITVNTIGDLTVEPNETFLVDISDPTNVTIANSRGTGTIVNDDIGGSVQFSSAAFTGSEFSGGATISITRTGGNGGGVSVRFRTQAGTALPGQDYTETTTTVIFAANETGKNVFIPIANDQLDEPDETVILILDTPVGVTIGTPSPAILTIQNSANVPDLSIIDASVVEGDNGTIYMQFSVRLSRPTQRSVSVDFATSPDTATQGTDYLSAAGTFTVRPGVTRANLNISVIGDFMFEPDETFFVNLSNVVNANLVDNQAIGRIINDEVNTGSSIQFVSVNRNNNGSANSYSLNPSVSSNGKMITFESFASDLASTDTNGARDVYVRNLQTGQTTLVSVNMAGTNAGNCESIRPVISGDGRFVAFISCASDLTSSGTPSPYSVFLRDLQTNATRMVSVNIDGNPGSVAENAIPSISYDGRYVVFQSRDQNLTSIPDTLNFIDIFVRDMQTNVTSLISINAAGNGPGNTDSGNLSSLSNNIKITPDGQFVLYPSAASNLVSTTHNGGLNIFVRDLTGQTTVPVSVNSANTQLVGANSTPSISDNGRFVFFSSNSGTIAANDPNNVSDVFRRDLQTNTALLVSANLAGTSSGNLDSINPSGSSDGRYVAFESNASDLSSSNDTNGLQDVYWRDVIGGTTKLVSINTAGTNGGNNFSSRARISADGQTILFTTPASDLIPPPADNNGDYDLYIRDIAGNFTKPVSANEGGTANGNQPTIDGAISSDGNVVAFASGSSNLVANDLNGFESDIFGFTKTLPPVPLTDFDGDGKTDLSVFRPLNSVWYVINSQDGSFRTQQFGLSTDIPVANDYDGDGKTDIAVFRQGMWFVFGSRTNSVSINTFGQAGDLPIAGDFDGDRRADLAFFRQGVWFIKESSDGNVRTLQFGLLGDTPVAADFDGDRRSDIGVFRNGIWYIVRSTDFSIRIDQFGLAGDKPVQGDFDGDKIADIAVFRPSTQSWYILFSGSGSFVATQFGISNDIPLKGDFDGDRKADIAVFRDGVWYILQSSNQAVRVAYFGIVNDLPMPGQP